MNKIVSEIKVVVQDTNGERLIYTRCLLDDGSVIWFNSCGTNIIGKSSIEYLNTEYAKLS